MSDNTAKCSLCNTECFENNSLTIRKSFQDANGDIKRGTDVLFCCDKDLNKIISQFTDEKEFLKIKMLVKTNSMIENHVYNVIVSAISHGNISPIRGKDDKNVFITRNPFMKRIGNGKPTTQNQTSTEQKERVMSHRYSEERSLTPREIYSKLSEVVIGQEEALRAMSNLIFQHLKVLRTPGTFKKNTPMILGPSGSGKTELAETTAEILGCRLISVNCSSFSPTGYKGDSVSSIVEKIVQIFGSEKSPFCVLYLDEVDKIVNSSKDTLKESVQQELLKMLDGGEVTVNSHRGEPLTLSFRNILIIASGAFPKLEESLVSKRISLGQQDVVESSEFHFNKVTDTQLIKYGLIPEFIGRFSRLIPMNKLDDQAMIKILRSSKKSILNDYIQLFKDYKCDLVFEDCFLLECLNKNSTDSRTGMRSLKKILDKKLDEHIFDIQSNYNGTLYLRSEENGGAIFNQNSEDSVA